MNFKLMLHKHKSIRCDCLTSVNEKYLMALRVRSPLITFGTDASSQYFEEVWGCFWTKHN